MLFQIHQQCCKSALTALGMCCDHGIVDDCGVCGGDNSCDFIAEFQLNISSTVGASDPVYDVTTTAKYKYVLHPITSLKLTWLLLCLVTTLCSFDVSLKDFFANTIFRPGALTTNFYIQRLYQSTGSAVELTVCRAVLNCEFDLIGRRLLLDEARQLQASPVIIPSVVELRVSSLYLSSGAYSGQFYMYNNVRILMPASGVNVTLGPVMRYYRQPAGTPALLMPMLWMLCQC